MRFVVRATWRIVFIVLIVWAALWALRQAADLVEIVVVACFLALAMVPGVNALVRRYGWSRGLATAVIFLIVVGTIVGLIAFLIPAIVDMSGKLSADVPRWLTEAKAKGLPVGTVGSNDTQILTNAEDWLKKNGGSHVLSIAGSGVALVFKLLTALMFTFLIAAGEPALRRTILRRLDVKNQQRFVDAWDTAISQTGGYFYSRLLLMLITGTCTFIVMEFLGMPFFYSLPLAFFGAFFVEFIPVVGSYVGISIPVLVTLAERGVWQAVILLVWAIIYQQIHDYLLSPRISSKTMTINAGIAFGSALLGGALAGPLGALFAMPTAGMVTVFLQKYLPSYDVVYESSYERDTDGPGGHAAGSEDETVEKKHRWHRRHAQPDTSAEAGD
ncbi:MAG: family transporter [Actinomycetota bacterium]|nr:family transporter [Actinomycetota bacterium]